MPLRRSQMMFSKFEILISNTLRRTRKITNHVVNRSVRRTQLFQFARRSWGKADRRHTRERNPPIFGWQQLLKLQTQRPQRRILSLRFVSDLEFFHGHAVAPAAHEALLRGVAEGVFAVLAGEGGVAEGVEEFP